jgi:zinc transport system substrate-binding protein
LSLVVTGCDREKHKSGTKNNQEPTVVVANYPLAFFVESLIGDQVKIIGPPTDVGHPQAWNPDDNAIAKMQNADLIFVVGADYDGWLVFTTLPEQKIVDTSSKMYRDFIEIKGEAHKHGNDGEEHFHTGAANYFWLDPAMAKGQVAKIADFLRKTYPEHAELIDANQKNLDAKLDELAKEFDSIIQESAVVFASDPRFAYLLRSAQMKHVYFHWTDHGKEELADDAWAKFDESVKKKRPAAMVFPFEPSAQIKKALGERQLPVIVLDSIEVGESRVDYFQRMRSNMEVLKALAFEKSGQ